MRWPNKSSGDPADWLIVGLGNPGSEYANTRHNAGYRVIEEICSRRGVSLRQSRGPARWAQFREGESLVGIGTPGSFMNVSGGDVQALMRRYGIGDVEKLVIVHDEIDLEPDRLRVRQGGGTAGHNGLKSIVRSVRSPDFLRVRVGVGRPPHERASVADWVLQQPRGDAAAQFEVSIQRAADAVEMLITQGFVPTMNAYNGT